MFPAHDILVASDLTRNCEPALRAAGQLALMNGARLHVLQAFELRGNPYVEHPNARVTFPLLVEEAEAGLAEQVRQTIPPNVDVASIKSLLYLPWKAIVERAREVNAELIVLGPHIPVIGDRFMGTTSDRVVRFADAPCLIVQRGEHFQPTRIAVGIDGSPASPLAIDEAIHWASAIAVKDKCTVEIVHCAPDGPPATAGNELIGSAVEEARARLANDRISVSGQVLVTDNAVDELVHYVERMDVHLLIMSSAGHGSLDRVLTGSTVSGVVGRVSCATLVVPYRALAK